MWPIEYPTIDIDAIAPVTGVRSLIQSMVVPNVVAIDTAAIGMEIQMIVGQTLTKARSSTKETAVIERLVIIIVRGRRNTETGMPSKRPAK